MGSGQTKPRDNSVTAHEFLKHTRRPSDAAFDPLAVLSLADGCSWDLKELKQLDICTDARRTNATRTTMYSKVWIVCNSLLVVLMIISVILAGFWATRYYTNSVSQQDTDNTTLEDVKIDLVPAVFKNQWCSGTETFPVKPLMVMVEKPIQTEAY